MDGLALMGHASRRSVLLHIIQVDEQPVDPPRFLVIRFNQESTDTRTGFCQLGRARVSLDPLPAAPPVECCSYALAMP